MAGSLLYFCSASDVSALACSLSVYFILYFISLFNCFLLLFSLRQFLRGAFPLAWGTEAVLVPSFEVAAKTGVWGPRCAERRRIGDTIHWAVPSGVSWSFRPGAPGADKDGQRTCREAGGSLGRMRGCPKGPGTRQPPRGGAVLRQQAQTSQVTPPREETADRLAVERTFLREEARFWSPPGAVFQLTVCGRQRVLT